MDVIGLDSVGFYTAVAPNGTALTEHQLFLAWKLVDVPTVCFDGDNAGRKAAVRAAMRALPVMEPGKSLRFASPPDGKDPDDLAREGGLEAMNPGTAPAKALVEARYALGPPDLLILAADNGAMAPLAPARLPDLASGAHAAFGKAAWRGSVGKDGCN